MTTFVLKESASDRARDALLRSVLGFSDSKELEQLGEVLSRSPGLVCAAFTKFFLRFQEEELQRGLSDRDAQTLDSAYRALEELSSTDDDSVVNLLQTEVFENLRGSSALFQAVVARLGARTRQLYEEWKSRNL